MPNIKRDGKPLFRIVASAAVLLICLVSCTAQEIKLRVVPPVIAPINGKLPDSVNLAVFAEGCGTTGSPIDMSKYHLSIAGYGVRLVEQKPGPCVISSSVTVDPNAPAQTFSAVLSDANGAPVAHAEFSVLDAKAGAIPPGLAPQVDVMWEVASQQVCNDVFGKRVARNFYCIEVKMGNDSGHSLQIAGIGFSRTMKSFEGKPSFVDANTSYASTRSVLLREEVLSPRNLFYHSVQATGLVMASFTPFFARPVAKSHFATAASILSGAVVQAIDIVGPDRVVTQLNNLDDQSFRDGKLVPNNSQIRTMIFVEKRALTEALVEVAKQLTSDGKSQQLMSLKDQKSTLGEVQKVDKQVFKNHSPFLVRMALGRLVIVGESIDFLQRLQFDSAVSSGEVQPGPTIMDVKWSSILSPGQTSTITVSGTSLSGAAVSGPTGKLDVIQGGTDNAFQVNVALPDSYSQPSFSLTVTTAKGTSVHNLPVDLPIPAITSVIDGNGATIESFKSGQSYQVVLKGKYLGSTTPFLVPTSAGTITDWQVISATEVHVSLRVDEKSTQLGIGLKNQENKQGETQSYTVAK